MSFAVVRHPDIDSLGVIPQSALESHQARGWYRVSDWRNEPADFYLPDFAELTHDLDAPAPEPEPDEAPAETTKENKA